MSQIVGQTRLFSPSKATRKTLKFIPTVLYLKIDLVSHPVVERLYPVKTFKMNFQK